MSLLLILGIMDLWTSMYLILLHSGVSTYHVAFLHSAYLFVKGIFFWGDMYSFIDIIVSFYILLVAIGFHNIILTSIAVLYLLQKSAMSLASYSH